MQFAGMNLLAIVLAAVVSFMFGWLWYGILFSDAWLRACGKTREEMRTRARRQLIWRLSPPLRPENF